MTGLRRSLRDLDPKLPRAVWTLEGGVLVNSFGTGIIVAFLVIYLHNVRGFALGTSGLVIAAIGGAGLVCAPLFGLAVDRIGARRTLAAALVLAAAGHGLFALVSRPWHAFLLAALAGAGSGAFWTSQPSLLAGLAPPERRHAAYAVQRSAYALGIGLGGFAGGLIATTSRPGSFTVLFALCAGTNAAFLAVLAAVPEVPPPPRAADGSRQRGGYREVLRHRPFMGIVLLNFLLVSVGYTQLELLPVFAKNEAGVSERAIGLVFLTSAVVLVACQLPVARLLEGRSRLRALALMPAIWAVAWLVVEGGGVWLDATAAALVFGAAAALFGLGECFHGPTQGPLVADLAPEHLRGRYWALSSNSWDLGYIAGPAAGGFLLAAEPLALFPLAAFLCLVAAGAALALDRLIPVQLRLTPGGGPAV